MATIDSYLETLEQWGNALSKNGDILLLGCNVARSADRSFITRLADLTNADIAASQNLTGSASLGGDWDLEQFTGEIETPLSLSQDSIDRYEDVLANEALENGKLRFGTGSEASVNSSGNLQQPFYFDSGTYFQLTYSALPLDNAIGIDGDGTSDWNINGTITSNPTLSGQVIDTSGFTATSGSKGYGVIVSTGTISINGKSLEVKNTYSE